MALRAKKLSSTMPPARARALRGRVPAAVVEHVLLDEEAVRARGVDVGWPRVLAVPRGVAVRAEEDRGAGVARPAGVLRVRGVELDVVELEADEPHVAQEALRLRVEREHARTGRLEHRARARAVRGDHGGLGGAAARADTVEALVAPRVAGLEVEVVGVAGAHEPRRRVERAARGLRREAVVAVVAGRAAHVDRARVGGGGDRRETLAGCRGDRDGRRRCRRGRGGRARCGGRDGVGLGLRDDDRRLRQRIGELLAGILGGRGLLGRRGLLRRCGLLGRRRRLRGGLLGGVAVGGPRGRGLLVGASGEGEHRGDDAQGERGRAEAAVCGGHGPAVGGGGITRPGRRGGAPFCWLRSRLRTGDPGQRFRMFRVDGIAVPYDESINS